MITNGVAAPPAVDQLDRGQGADGGAAHARPEDPDRQAAALGREPGVDERDADGEGGSADAEEEPADEQGRQRRCPSSPRKSTGTIVAAETSGNITRPPNRSVSAPTGMRPSEPTITGTATSRACWDGDSARRSLKRGPSGLSSAQAQKFTREPERGQREHPKGHARACGLAHGSPYGVVTGTGKRRPVTVSGSILTNHGFAAPWAGTTGSSIASRTSCMRVIS